MAVNKFGISILVIFLVALSRCTELGIITPIQKLLIDTDAGGDDAVAIIMAIEAEKLDNGSKIVGITCVNGNAGVNNVAINVLKTLKVVNRLDIPVYKGADHSLLLTGERDYYYGQDGFRDFYYPDPPSEDLIQEKHAVTAMIELVKAHPGEVTLVALGPLTNVALAIRMYPSFLNDLQQLIISGGSTEGRGNVRPGIEFNFFIDPAANYIVLNSSTSKPSILVPWEITRRLGSTFDIKTCAKNPINAKIWLLNATELILLDGPSSVSPDSIAMTIALTSGTIVTRSGRYYAEAIYAGTQTMGMIIVDYTNITSNSANTNIIHDIDMEIHNQLLFRYIDN